MPEFGREELARFGMTGPELEAWFFVSGVAGAIGNLNGWDSPDTHDMVHAAHVVQNVLLSRPVKRAGGTSHAPAADESARPPVVRDRIGSETALALGRAGLTQEETALCQAIATAANLVGSLPDLPADEAHACTHAFRVMHDIVIGQAVARASGLPRPPFGAYRAWDPDPTWFEQSREALAQTGLTEAEIAAGIAIARAAKQVHALEVVHETAWHDSMHAFRTALDGVLARPGLRAQRPANR